MEGYTRPPVFSPHPTWPLAAAGFHHRLREQASHDRAHPEPRRAVARQHLDRPLALRARCGSHRPAQGLQGVHLKRVFKDARPGVFGWVVAGPVFVQWRSCGGCSRGGPDDCRVTQRGQLAGQQHRHARHRRGSGSA